MEETGEAGPKLGRSAQIVWTREVTDPAHSARKTGPQPDVTHHVTRAKGREHSALAQNTLAHATEVLKRVRLAVAYVVSNPSQSVSTVDARMFEFICTRWLCPLASTLPVGRWTTAALESAPSWKLGRGHPFAEPCLEASLMRDLDLHLTLTHSPDGNAAFGQALERLLVCT